MGVAESIRSWASRELDLELPDCFEHDLGHNKHHLPRGSEVDFDSLVMIEIAEEAARRAGNPALSERETRRLLWRVRKRLQREAARQPASLGKLDHITTVDRTVPRGQLIDVEQSLSMAKDKLTMNELVVLALLLEGADAARIQEELMLSRATYYRRLKSIRVKLTAIRGRAP